jgi:hypothetical protein
MNSRSVPAFGSIAPVHTAEKAYTRFAHLTVVDHVDSRLDLLAHGLLDGFRDALLNEGCGFAILAIVEQLGQIGRPRETAGVGGEKSRHAAQHTHSYSATV